MAFIITECEWCEGAGLLPETGDLCPYCGGTGLED